jgi:peptidoglycan/LPS O-acetylase OafA/YrhL
MFVLGGLMARWRGPLVAWARALPRGVAILVAALALLLFDVRFAFGAARLPYRLADYLVATGSALVVLLVAARPGLARLCERGPIAFVGAVSYSFYLVHLPILLVVASQLARWRHGLWLAPPLGLALALVTAWIFHRAVERPFQGLGRALARPAPAWGARPATNIQSGLHVSNLHSILIACFSSAWSRLG